MKTSRLLLFVLPLLFASCHTAKKTPAVTVTTPTGRVSRQVAPSVSNRYADALVQEAYSWLGTPYVHGGKTKKGTDCSGFTMQVFQNALGIKIPRTSKEQSSFCSDVKRQELVVGDLVFFKTGGDGRVSHVGIYVGDEKVIHASTHGVMVNDLNEKYYQRCYHHCGRVGEYAGLLAMGAPLPTPQSAEETIIEEIMATEPVTLPEMPSAPVTPAAATELPAANAAPAQTAAQQPATPAVDPVASPVVNPRHKTARHH